jgi:hypothetical protein
MKINNLNLINELEKIKYKPYITEIEGQERIAIDFEQAAREERGQLLLTLQSKESITTLMHEAYHGSLLNFLYFLPDRFHAASIAEARYLANRINCVTLLPGFAIDDLNKRVFFRYSLPLSDSSQHFELLESSITLIINMIEIYSPLFSQLSLGANMQNLMEQSLRDCAAALRTM